MRLANAPPAAGRDEAFRQLCRVLNQVEDEMSGVAYDPTAWQSDGRLYPPQGDAARAVEGAARVVRFRSRGHNTFIGSNGAIEIAEAAEGVPPRNRVFEKSGADGLSVWQQATGTDE